MRNRPLVFGLVVALAIVGAVILVRSRHPGAPSGGDTSKPGPAPAAAQTLPAFSLPDISGNRVDSSLFHGKPTVVNFFATWCPSCRDEIPGFVAAYDRYRDRGLEVVGIALDTDTRRHLPGFIESYRVTYRVLLGDMATMQAFGAGPGIPATFFIGRNGRIVSVHVGYMAPDAFDSEVLKLL